MSVDPQPQLPSSTGDPTWEVAHLVPKQGNWSESDFLGLQTNRMAELVDGRLEVLPMPTWLHQLIVDYLVQRVREHIHRSKIGGVVLFAPLPTRLFPGTIREPDVLYVAAANLPKAPDDYPDRLDVVIEVVSEGEEARRRDYEDKRHDYARAEIHEYWIIDPIRRVVTVLGLQDHSYGLLGSFSEGQRAHGRYFEGFEIDVADLFSVADRPQD